MDPTGKKLSLGFCASGSGVEVEGFGSPLSRFSRFAVSGLHIWSLAAYCRAI